MRTVIVFIMCGIVIKTSGFFKSDKSWYRATMAVNLPNFPTANNISLYNNYNS